MTKHDIRMQLLTLSLAVLLYFLAVVAAVTTPGAPLGCTAAPLPFGLGHIPAIERAAENYCHS